LFFKKRNNQDEQSEWKADLHIHTVHSDGTATPEEIFKLARKVGLSAISITDHDSVEAAKVAFELSPKYDMEFISGIEFSCYEEGREYHILGYNIDIWNKTLEYHIDEFRKARFKRAIQIVHKLNNLKVRIDMDMVLEKAGTAPITRPHIAQAIVEAGFVNNQKDAFIQYIADNRPAYEPKPKFPIYKALKLINHCGGVGILAHPGRMITQQALGRIIELGLDGIEVVHPVHDKDLENYYHNIAGQFWLIETGGSDFHGSRDYEWDNIGKYTVPYSSVESIKFVTGR